MVRIEFWQRNTGHIVEHVRVFDALQNVLVAFICEFTTFSASIDSCNGNKNPTGMIVVVNGGRQIKNYFPIKSTGVSYAKISQKSKSKIQPTNSPAKSNKVNGWRDRDLHWCHVARESNCEWANNKYDLIIDVDMTRGGWNQYMHGRSEREEIRSLRLDNLSVALQKGNIFIETALYNTVGRR